MGVLICVLKLIRNLNTCSDLKPYLISCFKAKLNKVGKTTGPFMYDLNQNPYDYTVEVRNRFKGLELIEYLIKY